MNRPTADGWRPALRLFLLAVAVRLALWLVVGTPHPFIGDDQADFLAIRDKILATGQFLDPTTGLVLAHRDPGYPLFLAVLAGAGLQALPFVWAAQILLSSLTGVFLWLALRNSAGERAARLLGLLFLMQLSFASYSLLAYSETLSCCFAAGLLFGLEKWRQRPGVWRQIATGASGAAAVLTRASTLLGVAGVVVAATWGRLGRRRWWVPGAIALVLPLLLWVARNAVKVGVPVLNTTAIFQLYMGNNPEAPLTHSHRAQTPYWDALYGHNDRERARIAWRLAAENVVNNAGLVVTRALLRVPDALEGDRMLIGVARRGQFPEQPRVLVLACGALLILVTAVPTLLALACLFSPGPHWLASAGRWMFLGLLLTQILTIAHSRFSMPGWILLLPGAALMAERLQRGERAARIATAAAALILLALGVRQLLLR